MPGGLGTFIPRNLRLAGRRMVSGTSPEHLKGLLALAGNPTYAGYWDDFIGSDASTWPASANWMYPATVGTGTEVIGITAGIGGTLTCTTGGTNGNGAYQTLGLNWRGTEGFYYIARVQLDTITNAKFEVGVTDSLTNEGVVSTKSTPTFTATDGAVVVFDTTHNTSVDFISVKAGVVGANVASAFVMAAATYFTVELVCTGAQIEAFINGQFVGGGGITAATPLTPFVGCTTRATATRTLTVDYQGMVGPRGGNV